MGQQLRQCGLPFCSGDSKCFKNQVMDMMDFVTRLLKYGITYG